jgi:hypothetical protein
MEAKERNVGVSLGRGLANLPPVPFGVFGAGFVCEAHWSLRARVIWLNLHGQMPEYKAGRFITRR